jgi:hypothetical protein
MRQRLQLATLLLAWFMATGGQWDLMQVFAWGRMFANYSRVMPFESAFRLTFKPDNLCGVCKLVRAAKQQQSPAAPTKEREKILSVFAPVPAVAVTFSPSERWPAETKVMRSADRSAPPIPPPRTLAA